MLLHTGRLRVVAVRRYVVRRTIGGNKRTALGTNFPSGAGRHTGWRWWVRCPNVGPVRMVFSEVTRRQTVPEGLICWDERPGHLGVGALARKSLSRAPCERRRWGSLHGS